MVFLFYLRFFSNFSVYECSSCVVWGTDGVVARSTLPFSEEAEVRACVACIRMT